jgi:hypothetical protein
MHANFNEMLLAFLKNYKTNLELRYLVIESVGKVGQADAIRAAMAEKHKANVARLDDVIAKWQITSDDAKISLYRLASKQIDDKLLSELRTLKFLVTKKQEAATNTSSAVLDRGIYVHFAMVHNTLGLLASISMINNNGNSDLLKTTQNNNVEDDEELNSLTDWFWSISKDQTAKEAKRKLKAHV